MSLVTRCPRCKTLFRVTPAQLQARSGQVRCGRCMNVFDGFGALAPEQPGAAEQPAETHAAAATAAAGSAAAAPAEAAAAPPAASAAKQAAALPAAAAAREELFEPPKVPLSERLRARFSRTASPESKRAAVSIALALLLLVQLTYLFRGDIAARSPVLRALLAQACALAGCTVALPQRPELVKIEASDVHMIDPGNPSLIQLTATLRSYASYDLAYPALDLVLTNANEHALARRIFRPEEYLDGTRDAAAGMPPRAEITVALDLDTGDLNAAGFRLDLLAAPAP